MTIPIELIQIMCCILALIFNLSIIYLGSKSFIDDYRYNKKIKFEAKLEEYLRRKGLLK